MKSFKGKLHLLSVFLFLSVVLISFSVSAERNGRVSSLQNNFSFTNNLEKADIEEEFFKDEKEKVVISIVNFGRENPFKPYTPSEKISSRKEIINIDDIPFPPHFEEQTEISQQARELMNSRVNGILYDPYSTSVAIINIKGSEYMLNEGDSVHGIMVDKIERNRVTLKYGTNSYTIAVGEVLEGNIENDPVNRGQRVFAGSDYDLPEIILEE